MDAETHHIVQAKCDFLSGKTERLDGVSFGSARIPLAASIDYGR